MKVRHYDVRIAFLNGETEEDLFISQPEGYVSEGEEHLVCKLRKSLWTQTVCPSMEHKNKRDYVE